MGLLGILVGLGLLVCLAFRGWSVLLLAPLCGLVAAAFGGGRRRPAPQAVRAVGLRVDGMVVRDAYE